MTAGLTGLSAQTLFADAEVDFRLHRAAEQFSHTERPRHRVRRRRTLQLNHRSAS